MHSLPGRMRLPVLFWVYTRLKVPEPELRHVAKLVGRHGGLAIDAGANAGLYSYALSRVCAKRPCGRRTPPSHIRHEFVRSGNAPRRRERHYGEVGRYFRHRDSDLLHLPVWFLKLKNPVRYAIANGFSKGRA